MRIIKKYSNRRLYDTHISRYVKLDEIKDLVLKQVAFKIVDASTEEDKTNYVLLQIISDSESTKLPLFTTEILQNMIRFYGNPLQKSLSKFLEKSFSFLSNQAPDDSVTAMTELARKNMSLWSSLFNQDIDPPQKKASKQKTKKSKKK